MMARGVYGESLRHVRMLFESGAVGGLTDRQLLERFLARDGEAAERAFAVLVERHGPMVWRVCRRILQDDHDAQDAFQATFLVLVCKARSLWVRARGSLGGWLHAVACRVAARSRSARARRRAHEKRVAKVATALSQAARGDSDELGRVLHEEIGRLPENFRAAVVLCDLEGLTQEQAAQRLGWPSGTVRSRLARGRGRLQDRLKRRGLAPSAGALAALLTAEAATAGVPAFLVENTGRAASLVPIGQTAAGAVPVALAAGVLRAMSMTKLKLIIATILMIVAGASGTAVLALQQAGVSATHAKVDRTAGGTEVPKAAGTEKPPEAPAQESRAVLENRLDEAQMRLSRAIDRVVWSDRMHGKGYVSKAQNVSDHSALEQALQALKQALMELRKRSSQDKDAANETLEDIQVLTKEVHRVEAELRAALTRAETGRRAETAKKLLHDKDANPLSEAESQLAEAEVAAATAEGNLKQAELKLLKVRLDQAKR
jgi:RNA polymerase sigma factor (sigma-70 family)